MPARRRRTASLALVVVTGVLVFATTLAGYVRLALVDADGFANRATATLRDPSVRALIAERVTDELVLANRSELLAARPLIIGAISGIAGGDTFAALFHRASLDVHRAVFDRDQDTITLTLVDVGTIAAEALQQVRPQIAREIERTGNVSVVSRDVSSVAADAARVGDKVRFLALVLLGLTVAAAAAALVVSADRRMTVSHLGLAAVAAGVLVVVAYTIGRLVVLASLPDPEEREAGAAVWDGFLGDLRKLGWVVAGSGAVLAAASASVIHPDLIDEPVRRAWRILTTHPSNPWLRGLRAVGLVVAGALVVAEPTTALHLVATVAGVLLIQEGAETLLRLIYRPQPPQPEGAEEAPEPQAHRRERRRRIAVAGAAAAVVAAGATVFLVSGGIDEPRAAARGCNGSEALCDRRLDEVVLPATHNAMSVPLAGWFSAEQEAPIADQLEDGVRGLLIDTHYADRLPNGRHRTVFGSNAKLKQAVEQGELSERSVQAALRLRDRLGFRGEGERGMYLCHTFCELGATELEGVLEDIHDFLVTHPTEVLVVVNQDYLTPEDFVEAVRDADLERYVFRGPGEDGEFPTLREMIDSDQRLVLLAENEAGAAPWYRLAYEDLVMETPYTFTSVSALTSRATLAGTCRPNRGPEEAPLFLVNHWVSTDPIPKKSDAARVNAYGPLLRRARECERVRGHLPNLLAVNFYREGDLFRVVDTLNGIEH